MSRKSRSSHSNPKRKRIDAAPTGNQTLGMAWGANSASSKKKRSSTPFSDFRSYMVEKERKLWQQFQSDVENSMFSYGSEPKGETTAASERSSGSRMPKGLFDGVSIFVDGFTIPSNLELRSYMIKYGGRYENYFSKNRVTHIICNNLPESKVKNFRSFSKGLPVVKPQWILDSIAANKILPVSSYRLDQLANEYPQQQRLSAFFGVKTVMKQTDDFEEDTNSLLSPKHGEPSMVSSEGRRDICSNLSSKDHLDTVISNVRQEKYLKDHSFMAFDDACEVPGSSSLQDAIHPDKRLDPCNETKPTEQVTGALHNIESSSISANVSDKVSDLKEPQANYAPHTTLGDKNFVENFFKNSRLHFIGTWKNRYRKRYGGKAGNGTSLDDPSTSSSNKHVVAHIDMDCFFVSVVIRNRPDLVGKPVAVCHSDNFQGTAEISSANYPAREYGIKAGMFVRDAKNLCPDLTILPYDFEAYGEVADQFYDILHKRCGKVQALSCDEAYIELRDADDPCMDVLAIRKEIFELTRCTASAGIAANLLLARIATSRAKPNGQYYVRPDEVEQFLGDLPIGELPGVGYALQEKLNNGNLYNCRQLQAISKVVLQREYGLKTGEMLWNYCRGIDNRQIQTPQESKSVGAEVNWGVRFNSLDEVHGFLLDLSKEVSFRLQDASLQGRTITLKVKKRKKGAGEPVKFMGCGSCENLSHSVTLFSATDASEVLCKISCQIFASFSLDVQEVRGIGLQVSRLQGLDSSYLGSEKNILEKWLSSEQKMSCKSTSVTKERNNPTEKSNGSSSYCEQEVRGKGKADECHGLPHMSQLDVDVLESLPPEILSEINYAYNAEVLDHVMGRKRNFILQSNLSSDSLNTLTSRKDKQQHQFSALEDNRDKKGSRSTNLEFKDVKMIQNNKEYEGDVVAGNDPDCIFDIPPSNELDTAVLSALPSPFRLQIQNQYEHLNGSVEHSFTAKASGEIPDNHPPELDIRKDLLPQSRITDLHDSVLGDAFVAKNAGCSIQEDSTTLSMSQIDMSVLHELPVDIQREILDSTYSGSADTLNNEPQTGKGNPVSSTDCTFSEKSLWLGNPPLWVTTFKSSKCTSLKLLSECYSRASSPKQLSSALLCTVSSLPEEDVNENVDGSSVSEFSEILKQYIVETIKSDIEEIYSCFRLLKRVIHKSKFWHSIYYKALPFLQEQVTSIYGGILNL